MAALASFTLTNDWLRKNFKDAFRGKASKVSWIKVDAGEGLRVMIRRDGAVTFIHRYSTKSGSREEYTLGRMTTKYGVPEAVKAVRIENGKILSDETGFYSPKRDRLKIKKVDTIPELVDGFLEARASQANPLAAVTLANYKFALKKHLVPVFRDRNVYDPELPNTFREVLATLTPGAKSYLFRVVRAFGNWVRRRLRLPDNPFVGGFEDREKPAVRKRHGFFNALEIKLITQWLVERINDPETPTVRRSASIAILLLVLTGMRNSEVRESTWGMWDLERRKVFLPTTKTGEASKPFSAATRLALDWVLTLRTPDVQWVCPGKGDKKPVPKMTMWHEWQACLQALRAKLIEMGVVLDRTEEATGRIIHDLRRSFITQLKDKRLSIVQIAEIMRHQTLATSKYYAMYHDDVSVEELDSATHSSAEELKTILPKPPVPSANLLMKRLDKFGGSGEGR